jgi:hypothetical protein
MNMVDNFFLKLPMNVMVEVHFSEQKGSTGLAMGQQRSMLCIVCSLVGHKVIINASVN